jgi:hypothetical protein
VTTRIVVVRPGGPLPTGRVSLHRQLKPRSVGAFCPACSPPRNQPRAPNCPVCGRPNMPSFRNEWLAAFSERRVWALAGAKRLLLHRLVQKTAIDPCAVKPTPDLSTLFGSRPRGRYPFPVPSWVPDFLAFLGERWSSRLVATTSKNCLRACAHHRARMADGDIRENELMADQ